MSEQDNNKVGKAGYFFVFVVLFCAHSLIFSIFSGDGNVLSWWMDTACNIVFSIFPFLVDWGIIGALIAVVPVSAVLFVVPYVVLGGIYSLLKASDDEKEDMEKTIAKYMPMCRAQVEEWIPPEEELMKEELYRRRKAYADEHPGEGEWRNFKNPTYSQCVYNRRKKRAEKMARRFAEQEIRNRNFK